MESTSPSQEIAHLADVPVEIETQLDCRVMSMRSILDLDVGHVIRMTRSAGENIDVYVGGALVAFGEIVIVEDTLCVRITDFNEET